MSILLGAHNYDIHTVLASPNDRWVVATDWRGGVVLYDLAGQRSPRTLRAEQIETDIARVAFDYQDQFLFIHLEEEAGAIRRWGLEHDAWLSPLREPEPSEEAGTIAASPTRSLLAVATREGFSLWDPTREERLFYSSAPSVYGLRWLSSGEHLISWAVDAKTFTCWAYKEGHGLTPIHEFRPPGDMVAPLEITPGHRDEQVYTGGGDSVIRRWSVKEKREIRSAQAHTRGLGFEILEQHPRLPYLLTSSGLDELKLWDSLTLKLIATVEFPSRWEPPGPNSHRGYNVYPAAAAFTNSRQELVLAENWHYDSNGSRLPQHPADLAGDHWKAVLRRWSIDELLSHWQYPVNEVEDWVKDWMSAPAD